MFSILSRRCPLLATSCPSFSVCFSCSSPIPGLIWFGSVYLVTTAGFVVVVCFYCLCVFLYALYFIATMSFAGYFLSVLFCLLSMLISDSRFDLVWYRLSCDHGWIRSSSLFLLSVCFCLCSLFYRDDVLCWLLLVRPFLSAFHAHLRFPV